ncbi:MAG TPA: YCF48-related protein [Candidatus Kapabacteria bacterium]|nr:YCF48-related protein [Candidatus Kapabacteria bacterium]HPP40117.1 YCF48-related protein [Candidatus Kapabacteria bacterium]
MKKHLYILVIILLSANVSLSQWINKNTDATFQINSSHFVDANNGYIVGMFGAIAKTTNGGSSWISQNVSNTNMLLGVNFTNVTTGWACGLFGIILKTTNAGSNWNLQFSGTTNDLLRILFVNATTGWAIGRSGTIIKSITGGALWTPQSSGTTEDLLGISFINSTTGWVVGANGTILKTTNGGSSWVSLTSGTTENLAGVSFVNANVGYVVGGNGTILKTTNGGASWTQQTSGTTAQLTAVHFYDTNNGACVGVGGKILRTTNGGANWLDESTSAAVQLTDVQFVSPTVAYAVGYGGNVLRYEQSSLPPPNLISPANNSTNILPNVSLSWSNVPLASSYRVQVSTNSSFSNFVVNTTTTSTSFQLQSLLLNTTYYWRVCSKNATDSSIWSSIFSFTTTDSVTQNITLSAGWNLVSLNVLPFDSLFSQIKQKTGNKLIIAKAADGRIFSPPFANTLSSWNNKESYLILASDSVSFGVTGFAISPENFPINLNRTGWHWIPYTRNTNISPALGLISLIGMYDHVKDTDGNSYQTNSSGTLQNLVPGKGYIIYITNPNASLLYPPN